MKHSIKDLPEEWMKLVRDAMNSNVSKEQFKQFLEEKTENNKKAKNFFISSIDNPISLAS